MIYADANDGNGETFAQVIAVAPNRSDPDFWAVLTVECPYCKGKHQHGEQRPLWGRTHRVSDCGGGGYHIDLSEAERIRMAGNAKIGRPA